MNFQLVKLESCKLLYVYRVFSRINNTYMCFRIIGKSENEKVGESEMLSGKKNFCRL